MIVVDGWLWIKTKWWYLITTMISLEYSDELKEMLFTSSLVELEEDYLAELAKAPGSLTSQFQHHLSREEAIQKVSNSDQVKTPMFPSLSVQAKLAKQSERSNNAQGADSSKTITTKRKSPHCKKCKKTMLGHPRGHCPP